MSYEEFKRTIDTARDILVGAVPSPAGQIDQITYALMYKFMSDIDDQSVALGGKRKYFIDDYAKFNWHELMSPQLGAHERLELYREAIQTMAKNPNLPDLFREIYQNAFLPFNSANVLNLFLKEIDKFTHDENDGIGDAYEYLLSITGAQGDVGQFRTPRHIIEFIVKAVNPTKDDSVLDPAVGTAGFLIAAYNHVKSQHDGKDADGEPNNERELTSDEKAKLHSNYYGFDIDPTMVRTAKVNMYLHGFKTPDIQNHDTLSSEEYWDKRYDVILANPPFMTPKGGIQPHRKFSINANRAEVLFVDYIASHLKPNGRAGIVVPEGIIFQSGKAYKELRKNLVENSLYAVVSLPAGVFNPYAGVKTSVLLLDKELAKQRDKVLFIKVENDGYSLNAQRRERDGDQLPEALEVIQAFQMGEEIESELAHTVLRQDIRGETSFNLSGDRYKLVELSSQTAWPTERLGDIAAIDNGNAFKSSEYVDSGARVIRITNVQAGKIVDDSPKYMDIGRLAEFAKYELFHNDLLMSLTGNVGRVGLIGNDLLPALLNQRVARIRPDETKILKDYLFRVLNTEKFEQAAINSSSGIAQKNLSTEWLKTYEIPLPPIEIQREIVAELEGYQKIIDAAQTIVQTYKPTIKINPDWGQDSIQNLTKVFRDGDWIESKDQSPEGVRLVQTGNVGNGEYLDKTKNARYISEETLKRLNCTEIHAGQVLVSRLPDPVGRACVVPAGVGRAITAVDCTIIDFNSERMLNEYFVFYSQSDDYYSRLNSYLTGSSRSRISRSNLGNVKIPAPPIETQREIVAKLEAEQQLINANKKLIEIYQQKIKSKIAEV